MCLFVVSDEKKMKDSSMAGRLGAGTRGPRDRERAVSTGGGCTWEGPEDPQRTGIFPRVVVVEGANVSM